MEKILINWLQTYTGVDNITPTTTFESLRFDIFDQAVTVDFIQKTFNKNANQHDLWYLTVKDLINAIS
jgi:acyl carrier protein